MKIVIVNYFGILPNEPGATRHYDMSTFFQRKESVDVEFWINNINYHTDRHKQRMHGMCREERGESGVKVVYFNGIRHRGKRVLREAGMMTFSLFTAIRLLRSRADVVILSMPPVSNLLAWSAKAKRIPLIADVEDLWPLFIKESGINNKFILKYYDIQANSIYENASAIEAVSNGMLEYVKKHIDCSNKICWLSPLGVDISIYDQLKKNEDWDKKEWGDKFIVMYVGAHGLANDIPSVLDTIEEINKKKKDVNDKEIAYVFVGDGNYKDNILKYLSKKSLPNVYFEDAIPGDLVPAYLKKADVCLTNLRRLECFKLVRPNKIFQYMAAAKPIICGIWGESSDIVKESGSGICVDFTKPEKAADRIIEFYKSDLYLAGEKGNQYIRKEGSREVIFEEYFKKITEVINKNGRAKNK